MSRVLIGLVGCAGSGKSSVAGRLVRDHHFTEIGWADALKREVLATYPLTLDAIAERIYLGSGLHGEKTAAEIREHMVWVEKPKPVRRLLQEWGMFRRTGHEDYWLRRLEDSLTPAMPRVVIPDCRFPNELAWLTTRGGAVWWVDRPAVDVAANLAAGHVSEEAWRRWTPTLTLKNTGTLGDLFAQVDAALDPLAR